MNTSLNGNRLSPAAKIRGIYQRGNIFWFARMEDGRRTQLSLGTGNYSEAVAKAAEILQNPFLEESEPLEKEITAFLDYKQQQNEYSPASRESKQYALSEFGKFVRQKDIADIKTADVERFYRHLQSRVSESTSQGYITTIRSFFNRQVDLRRVRSNPVKGVKLARLDRKSRLLFCSPAQRDKLIKNAPNDEMRFILYCGFHAGMRKNEIIEARPEWFDLERASVHIRATDTFRPKDREARTVPLSEAFKQFLKGFMRRRELLIRRRLAQSKHAPFMLQPFVKKGRAKYRYDFRRPFTKYVKDQGCGWVTPHVMRHTFASLHVSKGTSIFKVSVWMGDDVRVVQQHYAKLSPQDDDFEKAFS
jgi:site-specific recombinase XerD